MIRKLIAVALMAAVMLTASWTVIEAALTRDNKVSMVVERVDGNRRGMSPDMTMYSNSDTFALYVTDGDSVSAHVDTVGLVGPAAWLIFEFDEQANAEKVWFQAKELEDGTRISANAGQDTTQSYAWGNWTCIFINGVAGAVPLNSIGLADSIRFKCYGTTSACFLNCNLRGEYFAPTWMPSDAAVD